MFNLTSNTRINKEDLVQVCINLPDIGFSNNENTNVIDRYYVQIKNDTINILNDVAKKQYDL